MKRVLLLFFIIFTISFGAIEQIQILKPGSSISGLRSSFESFFFIDNNWKLNSDLSFEYSFNFSELTDQEISTLTFYINDIPIKSESIKYDTISKNGSFLIPKDMIKFGRNKFTIFKFQTESCVNNEKNPANWLRVDKALLTIDYEIDNTNIDLSDFPLPFMSTGFSAKDKNINILLNENPTFEEKATLANMASLFGKLNMNFNGKFQVNFINDSKFKDIELISNDYIYISEFERISPSIKEFFSPDEKNNIKKGVSFKLSTLNQRNKLLIVSSTKENLLKNFAPIFETNNFKQLNGDFIVFPIISKNSQNNNEVISKNIGDFDINLNRNGSNISSIKISIPKDKNIVSLKLNLKYNFSELVANNNSTLKISINGRPLWDTKLINPNMLNEAVIEIPQELINDKVLFIEFQGNLLTEIDCSKTPMPWLTVLKESNIQGFYKDKAEANLGDFPHPFVLKRNFNKLGLEVSNNSEALSFMASLFHLIGQEIDSGIIYPAFPDRNNIIIGTPLDNKTLLDNSENLFVKYNKDFKTFIGGKEVEILGNNIYTGIQLVKKISSYDLLIFSDKYNYFENTLNKIKTYQFKGNAYLALNNNDGMDFQLLTNSSSIQETKLKFSNGFFGLVIFILVGIVFTILAVYIYKRKDF